MGQLQELEETISSLASLGKWLHLNPIWFFQVAVELSLSVILKLYLKSDFRKADFKIETCRASNKLPFFPFESLQIQQLIYEIA